jgi:hypothetical protein
MSIFDVQINNFQNLGTFNYEFDNNGNVIVNPSSSVFSKNYISIPLSMYEYDSSKISNFTDVTFTEFIPESPVLETSQTSRSSTEVTTNTQITETQSELNNIISSQSPTQTESEKLAIKQVILELRKKLGEGTDNSDFLDEFPYTALVIQQLNKK